MKILLIMDQFEDENNGTTMTARRLATTLLKHGHEVRVVCASSGKQAETQEIKEYPVASYHLPPIIRPLIEKQGMCIAKPEEAVLREAISWADIVHFLMPFFLARKGRKIAEELLVPCTAAFHVQPENVSYAVHLGKADWANRFLYFYFRKTFYEHFTHIHCPSRFIAGQLKEHGYQAKLHVISNGVASDFVYRRLPKKPEWQGKFVIVMVGRLSNEKRQDVLIRAVERSKYRDRIQLVLAGMGPNRARYERLGRNLPNPPHIQFYSHEELLTLLAMSDLYVHAADAEIEAISCIEAFASGRVPIISNSEKSATPQFALDERSLFEPGNELDLAGKIGYWIENPEERERMERVYEEQGRKYSLDACVRQMEEMFEERIADERGKNGKGTTAGM